MDLRGPEFSVGLPTQQDPFDVNPIDHLPTMIDPFLEGAPTPTPIEFPPPPSAIVGSQRGEPDVPAPSGAETLLPFIEKDAPPSTPSTTPAATPSRTTPDVEVPRGLTPSSVGGAALGGGLVGGGVTAATDLYRALVLGEDISMGEAALDVAAGTGMGAVSEVGEEVVGHGISNGIARAVPVLAGGAADVFGQVAGGGIVDAAISGITSTLQNGAALEAGTIDASDATANVIVDTGVGLASGLAGAATGAAIGSVIPVGGTLVGAGLGFAGGALAGMGVNALAEYSGFSDWAKEGLGEQLGVLETPLDVAWGGVNGGIDGAMTGAMIGGAGGAAMGALSTGATAAALGFCMGGPVGALLAGAAGAGVGALGGGLIGAGLGVVPGAGIGAGLGLGEKLVDLFGDDAA